MGCSAMGGAMGGAMGCSAMGGTMGCVGIDAFDNALALAINHLCPQLVAASFQGADFLRREKARVGTAGLA